MAGNYKVRAKKNPPNPNKTKTVKKTLLLDELTAQRIEAIAYEERRTLRDVVAEAFNLFFAQKK